MSDFDQKRSPFDEDPIVFDLESVVSSAAHLNKEMSPDKELLDLIELREDLEEKLEEEIPPVFKKLVAVELPELEKENRARLQMQSPNRLFFYWSMKQNPFQTLNRAFGETGSYALVAKLINLTRDSEEIRPIESEGSFWFSVDAENSYRAEVGFYAPNRPYVRLMFSNTVTTPRKRPSSRVATSADWNISANTFAQVLNVSGFKRDAFEVAAAGDSPRTNPANHEIFARFIERDRSDFAAIASEELRYALLLIASGVSIEHLRYRIDASLFALLEASAEKLSAENAQDALRAQFGIASDETFDEERAEPVFGSSLINFPRRLKRKRTLPDYEPVTSSVGHS